MEIFEEVSMLKISSSVVASIKGVNRIWELASTEIYNLIKALSSHKYRLALLLPQVS
jgi:hypothetical protein